MKYYVVQPSERDKKECSFCREGYLLWMDSAGYKAHELPEPGGMVGCSAIDRPGDAVRVKPGPEHPMVKDRNAILWWGLGALAMWVGIGYMMLRSCP